MLPEFFDVHCTVCHSQDLAPGQGVGTRRGAPQSFSYDTASGAAIAPEATWSRVADRTMPPMGREVNDTEAALLLDWANCMVAAEGPGDDDDSAR
jgi:mono/diheme cytochrome c family protein